MSARTLQGKTRAQLERGRLMLVPSGGTGLESRPIVGVERSSEIGNFARSPEYDVGDQISSMVMPGQPQRAMN